MSLPDHGEFDNCVLPAARELNMIDMGMTFMSLYLEDGNKDSFDAALTLFNRAYRKTFEPQPAIGLAMEIETAAAPVTAHQPHFRDVAEPGPVVHIATATLINPLPRPDELDE